MKLHIEKKVRDAMVAAARHSTPLEACGVCGGQAGRATRFYELTNTDASGDHYSMLPKEQFAAIKDMRSQGLELVAIWHSHPKTPARMSEEDLRLAFTPNTVYVVLSLLKPDHPDIRGFTVVDSKAVPVDIVVVDDSNNEDSQ